MSAAVLQETQPEVTAEIAPIRMTLPKEIGFRSTRLLLTVVFIGMLVSALHPELRSKIRHSVLKDSRTVVSTVTGDLRGDGSNLMVVKVKTRSSLALEIYDPQNSMPKLLGRIEIANAKDGYFNFSGQTANLAVDDVDGDGKLEVLVPSFDVNMVGQLNVFKYDRDMQSLVRVSDISMN